MYWKQKHGCTGKSKSNGADFGNDKPESAFSFLAAKIAVCRVDCARRPCGLVGREKIILAALRYFFPSSLVAIPVKQAIKTSRNKNAYYVGKDV